MGKDYINVIKGLSREDSEMGSKWLQEIVDGINSRILELLPSY